MELSDTLRSNVAFYFYLLLLVIRVCCARFCFLYVCILFHKAVAVDGMMNNNYGNDMRTRMATPQ